MKPIPHRGAASNASGRYERHAREDFDDGWSLPDEAPAPSTRVTIEAARSIISRNQSPDVPFDRSVNPYRGCEHGCIYCFARPTHARLGLSPGLDFETQLFAKSDAPRLLEAELRHPRYRPAPIAFGTNTDPYQPIERRHRIMRGCLEVLSAFAHPVTITTKGALVCRDIDLLAPMAAGSLASVAISVTTLDRDLCRMLEPRAAPPQARLDTIARLAAAGIPVGVLVAPVIPALNDHEMERILAAAHQAGAGFARYILLRLPLEVAGLMEEWLEAHAPGKRRHVMSLITQARDGKAYDPRWGERFKGTGAYADMLGVRFRTASRRLGLDVQPPALECGRFCPPPRPGDQLTLL